MDKNQLFWLVSRAGGVAAALVLLTACSKDNGVNRFLSDASDTANSVVASMHIVGSESKASGCHPDPYAPAISDPAPLLAGQSFTYQRGHDHGGKVTYEQGGSFTWQNTDGTKAGTGNWSTDGAKWCESFNASAHNQAVSRRCWPVIRSRGALCYGVTRLIPEQATIPPG